MAVFTYAITVTVANIGLDSGPFNLYGNLDLVNPIATGITRAQLLAGYNINFVGTTPPNIQSILVYSVNQCPTNPLTIPLVEITTTSTTSTSTTRNPNSAVRSTWSVVGGNGSDNPCQVFGGAKITIAKATSPSTYLVDASSITTLNNRLNPQQGSLNLSALDSYIITATPLYTPGYTPPLNSNCVSSPGYFPAISLRVCSTVTTRNIQLFYQSTLSNENRSLTYTITPTRISASLGFTISVTTENTQNPPC